LCGSAIAALVINEDDPQGSAVVLGGKRRHGAADQFSLIARRDDSDNCWPHGWDAAFGISNVPLSSAPEKTTTNEEIKPDQ
jgi:hypothetical protein